MKRYMRLGLMVALFASVLGQAAEIEIGFRDGEHVPAGALQEQGEALEAFNIRYGNEPGLVQAILNGGKLLVFMQHKRYTRATWDKMQRNGDAYLSGGRGIFKYTSSFEPPTQMYRNVGRITMWEGEAGSLPMAGFPFVSRFMLRVPKECSVSRATVTAANQLERLIPTKLVSTEDAGISLKYVYDVNGGAGTQVSHLNVTFAPKRRGFFRPHTNCDVQFFLPMNDGGGVPQASGN